MDENEFPEPENSLGFRLSPSGVVDIRRSDPVPVSLTWATGTALSQLVNWRSSLQPPSAHDLVVVYPDSELSAKQHNCQGRCGVFFTVCNASVRYAVGREATIIRLILVLGTSRIDYCNSLLAGILMTTIEPLQRVQNAAARMVFTRDAMHRAY